MTANSQVHLKAEGEKLLVLLPKMPPETANDWGEIFQQLKYCLKSDSRSWHSRTPVHLVARDRLLDGRQLQAFSQILQEADLQLQCIRTSRRQTAVAAATAGYSVQEESLTRPLLSPSQTSPSPLADPLYLKTTVRSGTTIRHPGTVVIWGDVNPGGEVIADGDIMVWGSLRGIAHGGARGSQESCILALRLEPTQLRIADSVATVAAASPENAEPEVAYLTKEGIRIGPALQFTKIQRMR